MKSSLKALLLGFSSITLLTPYAHAFDGPGVELIGSGACAFIQEAQDLSYTQIRVRARNISQKHLGVPLGDSVQTGTCTTHNRIVDKNTSVPSSWSDLMTLGIDIRCHNVSARTECFGTWTQTVLPDRAVKVDCVCSDDPL
jgi:hypothetical protein